MSTKDKLGCQGRQNPAWDLQVLFGDGVNSHPQPDLFKCLLHSLRNQVCLHWQTAQLSSIQGWTWTFQFLSLCWITRKFSLFLFKDFSVTHLIISPSSCRKYLRFRDLEFAHLEEGNWHISCSVLTLPKSLSPGAGSFPLPSPALWISQMPFGKQRLLLCSEEEPHHFLTALH